MPASWSQKVMPDRPTPIPKARYAHLSSVSGNRLFIIGGQDLTNVWLDDVYVFDLNTKTWVLKRDYPRHCGTYRSVAVSASQRVRLPQDEFRQVQLSSTRPTFRTNGSDSSPSAFTSSESLLHLPYSAQATEDFPNDLYLYSNYNVSL